MSDTVYDVLGRVLQTIDHRQNVTRFVYDGVGRRLMTITNYVEQGMSDPADWEWDDGDHRWENGPSNAIDFGTDNDQNRISQTTYDRVGRVVSTRDAAGLESRFEYDALGRRTQAITNFVDGEFNGASPDEDLISSTVYNKAGQVVSTIDARETQTVFTYDTAGRRLTVTQAAESPLASTNYTGYDKAVRTLRSIVHYVPVDEISPDTKTAEEWDFAPSDHGRSNDVYFITEFAYDLASRRMSVTDPAGNVSQTTYFKDWKLKA